MKMNNEIEKELGNEPQTLTPRLQPAVADPATAALMAGPEAAEDEPDAATLEEEQEDPVAGRELPGEPAPAEEDAGKPDAAGPPPEEVEEEDAEASAPPPPAPELRAAPVSPPPAPSPALPEAAPPAAAPTAAPSMEAVRQQYWRSVLTGSPETVPDAVRGRAGLGDAALSDEQEEYRLLSAINRSWAVDHLGLSREEVRSGWARLRSNLARRFKVADDEQELFAALSLEAQDAPRRERVTSLYEAHCRAALLGREAPAMEPQTGDEQLPFLEGLALEAQRKGRELRRRHLPLAREVAEGLDVFAGMEEDSFSAPRVFSGMPGFARAVDALAEMDEGTRQLVYAIAQEEYRRAHPQKAESFYRTLRRSVARGATGLGIGMGQAVANMAVATMNSAGSALGQEWGRPLREGAQALDRRARMVEELRGLLYEEVHPIRLREDAGLAGRLAVDAAGTVPAAIVACCGGAGFASLGFSAMGEAVAAARQRAPEGSQALQYLAGMVGGAVQAGIYAGMSRVGGQLLSNSISRFARSRGKGACGYSLASLGVLGAMVAEEGKLLLAGKAAHAAGLASQELAARVEQTASNINWKEYGDNAQDIELILREAAMALPFLLIASGRVALRHFRSRDAVLGDGHALQKWGIDEATRDTIMKEPDINRAGELLRDALRGSRRWSFPALYLPEAMQALRLLNSDYFYGFKDPKVVADFLRLPAESSLVPRPPFARLSADNPEHVKLLQERHLSGEKVDKVNRRRLALALQLWDEWAQKAHLVPMPPGAGELMRQRAQARRSGMPDYGLASTPGRENALREPIPTELRRRIYGIETDLPGNLYLNYARPGSYYHGHAEEFRMPMLRDRIAEIHNLCYRALLISFPLDTLSHSTRDINQLRQAAELGRASLLEAVGRSVLRRATGVSEPEALDELDGSVTRYFMRRRYAPYAPGWMSRVPTEYTGKLAEYARATHGQELEDAPDELKAAFGISLGLRACSRALFELLPGNPDFQTALARGLTPAAAYLHLLSRELGIELADAAGVKEMLEPFGRQASDMENYTRRNEAAFEHYRRFTGCNLESSGKTEDGTLLWRVRRPNGRYTRWHAQKSDAINDMVANSSFTFMPFSADLTGGFGELKPEGYDLNLAHKASAWQFTGYDNLCRFALRDLASAWVESAPFTLPGMSLAPQRTFISLGGRKPEHGARLSEGEGEKPTEMWVDTYSVSSPLRLAQARFHTYWWRQLNSGLLSAERAGEELVRLRVISPEEWARVQRIAEPLSMPRGRNIPLRLTPPPDILGRNRALTAHLTDFSLRYLTANLDEMPLPPSVIEWFRLAPLCPLLPGRLPGNARRLRMKEENELYTCYHNRLAARELRAAAPGIEAMRLAVQHGEMEDSPLVEHFRRAVGLNRSLNMEQGWCARICGPDALMAASPAFLHLMERPVEGWQAMDELARDSLRRHISAVCRDVPTDEAMEAEGRGETPDYVELALQNLQDVLHDYPHLHDYNVIPPTAADAENPQLTAEQIMIGDPGIPLREEASARSGYPLPDEYRMAFAPAETEIEPIYTGGSLKHATMSPARYYLTGEIRNDSRVLPAVCLLRQLRSYLSELPYVRREGIQWKGELYGGHRGKRPPGLDDSWMPETPLRGLLPLLHRLDEIRTSTGSCYRAYGVELPGLGEEVNLQPFSNITLYRHLGNPSKLCRLMPGDSTEQLPAARAPYVVQSIAGISMDGKRTVSGEVAPQVQNTIKPLEIFYPQATRMGLAATRERNCRAHMERALNVLLETRVMPPGAPIHLDGYDKLCAMVIRLVEDSGFSRSLHGLSPQDLTSGQVYTLRLAGAMVKRLCEWPRHDDGELERVLTELKQDEDMRDSVLRTLCTAADSAYRKGAPLFREVDFRARLERRRESARRRRRLRSAARYAEFAPVFDLFPRGGSDAYDGYFGESEGGRSFMESLFDESSPNDFPEDE